MAGGGALVAGKSSGQAKQERKSEKKIEKRRRKLLVADLNVGVSEERERNSAGQKGAAMGATCRKSGDLTKIPLI